MKKILIITLLFSSQAYSLTCGINYSKHLSSNSDLGSDIKSGAFICDKNREESYELGFQAITPPNGDWNKTPVYLNGLPQKNDSKLSTLKDTFVTYLGYSNKYNDINYNIRAGFINNSIALIARDFIDAEHRLSGIENSRHSPLTSDGKALIQLSFSKDFQIYSNNLFKITNPIVTKIGSLNDSIAIGGILHIQKNQETPYMPNILYINSKLEQDNDFYIGAVSEFIGYDLSTNYLGTKNNYNYTLIGYNYNYKNWHLNLEFKKDISDMIDNQSIKSYPYMTFKVSHSF